ncbi:MAG: hypothetical protein ACPGVD_11610, partial [Flavobacteriales bacterium]
ENVDPGIILFHVDDYEYYTKTLLKLIDKGQAPPSCLADFVDSYQRRVKEKQKWIYGIYEGEFPEYYIDYENLDKRRVSIGLPTMEMQQKLRDLRNQYYFPVEE